jgi:hypothetical protein
MLETIEILASDEIPMHSQRRNRYGRFIRGFFSSSCW